MKRTRPVPTYKARQQSRSLQRNVKNALTAAQTIATLNAMWLNAQTKLHGSSGN